MLPNMPAAILQCKSKHQEVTWIIAEFIGKDLMPLTVTKAG